MKKTTCSNLPRVSVTLYLLVIVFNLSSWIDLNGVWSELPLLVQSLPEYWALGSYVTVISIVGNIFQWIFFAGNIYKPKIFRHVPAIYVIITVGFTSLVLQAFFWHKTSSIGGEIHSVAFLTLVAFLSSVDHVSSVAFLAFMVILPSEYMTAFYVGDGLCSLIPSLLGLIQGAGEYDCVNITKTNSGELSNGTSFEIKQIMDPPLFSVSIFFGLLSVIMVGSGIAFSIIYYHPWAKQFHVRNIDKNELKENKGDCNEGYIDDSIMVISYKPNISESEFKDGKNLSNESVIRNEKMPFEADLIEKDRGQKISKLETGFLLFLFSYLYGVRYGCLYSMQSYSLLPYGPLAYSLGNRLPSVVLPLVSFIALFYPTRSTKAITFLTCLGTVPAVYIIILATNSPYPPLYGTDAGIGLSVFSWCFMTGCWGYATVGIAIRLKEQGKKTLMLAGLFHSIGGIAPNVTMFLLVSNGYFKSSSPC